MGVLGTGVAAGVAQTALQAQEVARRQDTRVREKDRQARRVKDIYETHLKVLDEHDDAESSPRLVVDDQMQDRRPPPETPKTPELPEHEGRALEQPPADAGPPRLDVKA